MNPNWRRLENGALTDAQEEFHVTNTATVGPEVPR